MTLIAQREIEIVNHCGAIYDEQLLIDAILWFSEKPVQRKKAVFLHGRYAAVSIGRKKVHIHRLIGLYRAGNKIMNNHFHHINGDKMDNRESNIASIEPSIHLSEHNKGKAPSALAIKTTIERNRKRKGCRTKPHRPDVTPWQVYEMRIAGLSFNQISLHLKLDWSCVKQRYDDFIHDNQELLKNE